MGSRFFLQYEGTEYDTAGWAKAWSDVTEGEAAHRRQILAEGTFVGEDGEPLPHARQRFLRAEILGTYGSMPRAYDPTTAGPVRAYVPGLWDHGTIPMLGGPPKVGKSSLVSQLAASLIIPDRPFLDAFDPVSVNEAESRRHVWLINAENPPAALHQELVRLGLEFEPINADVPFYSVPGVDRVLIVEHLDQLGGADVFDMTSDEQREFWEYRILKATETTGEPTPLTLIADGVTAMLNADTTRYGRWFAGFRKLLKALDIPNGLAVGHSGLTTGHLMNGVESMAGPDGLWMYDAKEPDKYPTATRYFQTSPRLHGPRVERAPVIEGGDGMLRLRVGDPGTASAARAPGGDRRDTLVAKLREAGTQGILATPLTGSGAEGQANRAELDRMQAEGLAVMKESSKGRARPKRWWLKEFAPPA